MADSNVFPITGKRAGKKGAALALVAAEPCDPMTERFLGLMLAEDAIAEMFVKHGIDAQKAVDLAEIAVSALTEPIILHMSCMRAGCTTPL